MSKPRRDFRSLLHVPQDGLQVELEERLATLGFPSLRPAHSQLLLRLTPEGVRLPDLVAELGLPKQTIGDMVDDLEALKLVERCADPDHGVIKRVRLGAKGKAWMAEVRKVAHATETRWAQRLGRAKMRSLRALLEELAHSVEAERTPVPVVAPGPQARRARR